LERFATAVIDRGLRFPAGRTGPSRDLRIYLKLNLQVREVEMGPFAPSGFPSYFLMEKDKQHRVLSSKRLLLDLEEDRENLVIQVSEVGIKRKHLRHKVSDLCPRR
jgi:hypothetical protein